MQTLHTSGRCVPLVGHFEHKYDYVTNEGRTFFFRTNRDGAAKYKVVKIALPPAGDALETDAAALAALPFEVRRVWVLWRGRRPPSNLPHLPNHSRHPDRPNPTNRRSSRPARAC